MAVLARKLNELSQANADGLLTDDEYRLLRKDIFERYSESLPAETPVVPAKVVASRQIGFIHAEPPPRIQSPESPLSPSSPKQLRSKSSMSFGVANFIRKATGRKPPPAPLNDLPSSTTEPAPIVSPRKLVFLPRVLSRNSSSDVISTRSSSSATTRKDSISYSSHKASLSSSGSDTFTSPPTSPITRPVPSSSRLDLSSAMPADDIFEDGGLTTTKEIRQALVEIEIDGKKIIEAFDSLELAAMARHQERISPRRPPLPSHPSFVTLLSSSSSSTTLVQPDHQQSFSTRKRSGSDAVSLASKSNTSNGRIKSPTSPPPRTSAISGLKRKGSVSSISSQTPSFRSVGRISHSNSLSRSTGHLPLAQLAEDDELTDIRRRRQEVVDRYDARREYLRARLKGAELHEKLLRR